MDERIDEEEKKHIEEEKAKEERRKELTALIETEGAEIDKLDAEDQKLGRQFLHGMIDLTFFAGSSSLRERAQAERERLYHLIDTRDKLQRERDVLAKQYNKHVDEHEGLATVNAMWSRSPGALVGGILGGAIGRVLSDIAKEEKPTHVTRCDSTKKHGETGEHMRCERVAGHEGAHKAGGHGWNP